MQDGKHGPIGDGVQEFVGMPGGGERASFRLSVADDACHDQGRVIEHGAESVAEGISQLAAFMDGAGAFGRDMAGNATRKRKLGEQFFKSRFILADMRVYFGVSPFQVGVGDQRGTAMPRASDVDHVQVPGFDHTVEMYINEVLARRGTPVPEEHMFDMFWLQWSL